MWAVVTLFSCLALVDDSHSFIPKWKPPFVSDLAPEDRCHLNGLAMSGGAPLYATALGSGDSPESWRGKLPRGGVLIHVPSGNVVLKDLPMPHSPRIYDGRLYMLFSATGELVEVKPESGSYDVITKLHGFIRGMARHGDYLFIGQSRLRKKTSTFKDLPIAEKAKYSGVTVVHAPTGAIVGSVRYASTVDEIFDVQVLPSLLRPGIINTQAETYKLALTTPQTTYWARNKKP